MEAFGFRKAPLMPYFDKLRRYGMMTTASTAPARYGRIDSPLIKGCAAEHNVSERAVRAWRRNNDPRWQAYIHSRAQQSGLPGIVPADVAAEAEQLLDPEAELMAAARRLAAVQRLCDKSLESRDGVALQSLLRSAGEASKVLAQARAQAADHRQRMGALRPASDFTHLKSLVQKMLGFVASMPTELCGRLQNVDSGIAHEILQEWVEHRFSPEWEAAIESNTD
jgi:hypothetical protein